MPKRTREKHDPAEVVMVKITVQPDGTLTVTVNGAPYLPPEFSPPWRRSSFPHIVDAISQHTGKTLRVDVIEIDGRVITDFRTPPKTRPGAAVQGPAPAAANSASAGRAARAPEATPPPRFVQFAGSGFIPGEDVAVAIVTAHTESGPDGIARAVIDARTLDHAPTSEVVLLGRISATVCIGTPK